MTKFILSVCSGDYTDNEIDTNCFGLFNTEEEAEEYALDWIECQKKYYRKIFNIDTAFRDIDEYINSRYDFYYVIKSLEELSITTRFIKKN
jgi:hypothetical protein